MRSRGRPPFSRQSQPPRPQVWAELAACAALLCLVGALGAPPAHAQEQVPSGDVAPARGTAPQRERATPKRQAAGLSSALQRLVQAEQQGRLAQTAQEQRVRLDGDRVQVTIRARPGQAASVTSALSASGGTITASYRDFLDAYVPIAALPTLAQHPATGRVDLPIRPRPSVLGEGISLTNAAAWQTGGWTGAGVKIGIVDLGFQSYTSLLGTELPSSVHTSCTQQPLQNGEVHGTAVAEIVHEMAPDAELFLVNFNTAVEMANAVLCLADNGVTIVNHSVGWTYHAPGDGSGLVNEIVDDAVSRGIFWANSSGNAAADHWAGSWSDPDVDFSHDFVGSDEFQNVTLQAGLELVAALRWNETWGGACNDYDLYLWNSSGAIVAWSANPQACGAFDEPLEVLAYVPPSTGTYYLEIYNYWASGTHSFDLITLGDALEYPVAANSLLHPADNASPGAASVGAVNWAAPTQLEWYSSQGPTTDNRLKPDLVAPDRVSGTSYGSFPGTSAASPHVAGAAALVKQANPGFTPAQIKAYLQGRAVDLGVTGADSQFGMGRLHLGQAVLPPQLNASLAYQGRGSAGDARWAQQVRLTLYPSGSAIPSGTYSPTTDAQGAFSLQLPGVGLATYDLELRHPQSVSNRRVGVSLVEGANPGLSFGTLAAGDVNGDNLVNALDFSLLRSVFGNGVTCARNGGSIQTVVASPCADLDADGLVNLVDFSLLASSFGQFGPQTVTSGSAARTTAAGQASVRREGVAELVVEAPRRALRVGQRFEAQVVLEAGSASVDGAEVHLGYNSAVLRVLEVQPGAKLEAELERRVDPERGRVAFAAGTLGRALPSGRVHVAAVRFEVLAETGADGTALGFVADGGRRSLVTLRGQAVELRTRDARVHVQGPEPRPEPGPDPTPAPEPPRRDIPRLPRDPDRPSRSRPLPQPAAVAEVLG